MRALTHGKGYSWQLISKRRPGNHSFPSSSCSTPARSWEVSTRTCLAWLSCPSLLELPVSEIATKRVITLLAGSTLKDTCSLITQHKLKKVPATKDGKLIGVLCRSGVMRYAMESAL